MTTELRTDLETQSASPTPIKRAAYSDRTAWLMAILSEIAYMPFDEEKNFDLKAIAKTLAAASGETAIEQRLLALVTLVQASQNTKPNYNAILKQLLACGGFDLVKILHCPKTDTQGFVAVRPNHENTGNGMVVVAFRGTQQIADWITNVRATQIPVRGIHEGQEATVGKMHQGFNQAFQAVRPDMELALKEYQDLPLYFTGHSLGGALATVATWYHSADSLAASYTFGAPRVANDALVNRYRTPIYRIVNGCDPVPMVPPAGIIIDVVKFLLRIPADLFSPLDRVLKFAIKYQGFRHGGDQRYLTISDDLNQVRLLPNVGSVERAVRQIRRMLKGEFSQKRIDKYHSMTAYREKLGNYARRRSRNYQSK